MKNPEHLPLKRSQHFVLFNKNWIVVVTLNSQIQLKAPCVSVRDIHHTPRDTANLHTSAAPVMRFVDGGDQYTLDLVRDVNDMNLLREDWQKLERACGEPFIYFQSYDWCKKWCDTFANTGVDTGAAKNNAGRSTPQIHIYALWRNSELVMVWPLMLAKTGFNLTNLTFLCDPHGQYGNIICNRDLLKLETAKQVWQHIRKNCGADAITLDKYPQSSMLKEIMDGEGIVEKSERYSSILNLDGFTDWDTYNAALSRKTRKQRNRRRNKLAKTGAIDYQTHWGGSEQYEALVDLALQWKNVWLDKTGRFTEVLSDEKTKQFLSSLSGTCDCADDAANGAVLGVLRVDGKPIGIEIGMCLDGHYYSYLGAFDWGSKHLSPGKIQIEEAQIWAKKIGLRKFDFLGDPADYKTEWTNSTDALESKSVAITLRGFIYCVCWKAYLLPAAKKIFNDLDAGKRIMALKIMKALIIRPGNHHDKSIHQIVGDPIDELGTYKPSSKPTN